MKIAIGIATFKRPDDLRETLRSLEVQNVLADLKIVIADDDPVSREGVAVAERMSSEGYRWPIDAVSASANGVASVRNLLVSKSLEDATVDFVAMIDDDEWADVNWLQEMLKVQGQTGADVVLGPVVRVFDREPPEWAISCSYFKAHQYPTGVLEEVSGPGTGNVLLSARRLKAIGPPWFDVAFNRTGGEDTDFFIRLKVNGWKFAWANEAIITERVPLNRMRVRWVLRRAFRTGLAGIAIREKYASTPRWWIVQWGSVFAAIGVHATLLLFALVSPSTRVEHLRRLARALGKATALSYSWFRVSP